MKWQWGGLAILVIGVFVVLGRPPVAQPTATVGWVDAQAASATWTMHQDRLKQLEDFAGKLQNRLDERMRRYPLLMPEEWDALVTLMDRVEAGSPLTNDQQAQYRRLQELSDERDRRLAELQGTTSPTEEQSQERRELQTMKQQALDLSRDLERRYSEQILQRRRDVVAEIEAEFRKAVQQVAQQEGLTMVLDKSAVVYGGTDVTPKVVEVLNANAQPTTAAPAP